MIGDLGHTIQGRGDPKRRGVREVFLPLREDCLEYLRKKRWKEGMKCSYCGFLKIWVYECRGCGRYFNDLTGTIFERHHFPIEEMFYILKEMEAKSTLQISEGLGRDYDSKYARRISLEGVVEVKEVYVHAGEKGKKRDVGRRRGLRKRGKGTWEGDKPPVLTIVKRG
jgi:hypothetical protein